MHISLESHGGVEYFEQALELPEIRAALRKKKITASIQVVDPLEQVKKEVLKAIKSAPKSAAFIFQTLEKNIDLYSNLLAMPEIKTLIKEKNIKIQIQTLDRDGRIKPDIIIATYNDIAKGSPEQFYE